MYCEMKKQIIYLDNASTTPITQPVLEAMIPYLTEYYGNPSSLYSLGTKSKTAIEIARKKSLKLLTQKQIKLCLQVQQQNQTTGFVLIFVE